MDKQDLLELVRQALEAARGGNMAIVMSRLMMLEDALVHLKIA